MERSRVRSECHTVWTDALLFYGAVFSSVGCGNGPARISFHRPWAEWLDVVRSGDHCGWRVHLVDHGKSGGEISVC